MGTEWGVSPTVREEGSKLQPGITLVLSCIKFPLALTNVKDFVAGVSKLSMWILRDRMVFEVLNQVGKCRKAFVSPTEFV